jgi:hypothetical protein
MMNANSQTAMSAEVENQLIGLKTQVSRQVSFKESAIADTNYTEYHMVQSWKLLHTAGLHEPLAELIWNYATSVPSQQLWKMDMESELIGVYSTISPYLTKTGRTSQCHFTANHKYIGSVTKLGDKPISYRGHFLITKKQFTLNLSKLATIPPNSKVNIECLFDPINPNPPKSTPIISNIIDDDDEDTPVALLIQKRSPKSGK